jgi:phenylacetyl-CoA:acceptor oxidoreductase
MRPNEKPSPTHRASAKIPVYCNQCAAGPDLMKVEVRDGTALRIEPNFDIAGHPAGGRVCVKAYGLIQKTYNPHRIKQPMRRTNPRKGRDQDPGFVAINWDEALDTLAERLNRIRARGLRDESGYPRVAFSLGGGDSAPKYMGTFAAFLAAWGPVDMSFGGGAGVKCYHSEHFYGELWHRAFIAAPDTLYADYIINCGKNIEASSGVTGTWRHADARARGLKRVHVEPHLSITAALSAQWVPIKPKTDAAFLYALIHSLLHEKDWRKVCDVPFLRNDTSSPYLVGPNGYYLRDPATLKPLVWDEIAGSAKPFDEVSEAPALTGTFHIPGVEIGPDEMRWHHERAEAQPAFQKLIDHMAPYSPEWAAGECDVTVECIRQIADEYLAHARVGDTIEIEGERLPFRPVSIMLGKSVNNGWGGYHVCWARSVLAILVGALEVPGSTVGTAILKLNEPGDDRLKSISSMNDGFMEFPFNDTSREAWERQPSIRNAYRMLVPLSANSPRSPALGPTHLPWIFHRQPPKGIPRQTVPDVWITFRTNPAISIWNAPRVAEVIADFPFTVSFAYTVDETNYMADLLLPEATDLESLQLIRVGGSQFMEQFWHERGWAIRQPVVQPPVDARDITIISTDLARRTGTLEAYINAINAGRLGIPLRTEAYDYSLSNDRSASCEEIWDCVARAASHELSDGSEVHGIEWFKAHGYMVRPIRQVDWYLYPELKRRKLRFELPYQERLKRHGAQLAARLREAGINWWDRQLAEYEAMPTYTEFPQIWIDYAAEVGRRPEDFPFWALTTRSMQFAWGANVTIPIIHEVAQNVAGHRGVIINRRTAKSLGIREGDEVVVESPTGVTQGRAELREGIRPDTVVMVGQFDHWATPIAKDYKLPSLNSVTGLAISLTDNTGSSSDVARVRICKAQ